MKILVAGNQGFIGSEVSNQLRAEHEVFSLNRNQVDFLDFQSVKRAIGDVCPDIVVNAVGKVAGVKGNMDHPADLLFVNAQTALNISKASQELGIQKLVQYGSACVYPLSDERTSKPEDIGTGKIESSSKSYATAKLLSIEYALALRKEFDLKWVTLIPSNLYGVGDWNSESGGHVAASLFERFLRATEAKQGLVSVWGDGESRRNFLNVSDLAGATKFLIDNHIWNEEILNVSGDPEVTIKQLSQSIAKIVGYEGEIHFDNSMPNGARRKALDDSKLRSFGWKPKIDLQEGLKDYFLAASSRL